MGMVAALKNDSRSEYRCSILCVSVSIFGGLFPPAAPNSSLGDFDKERERERDERSWANSLRFTDTDGISASHIL